MGKRQAHKSEGEGSVAQESLQSLCLCFFHVIIHLFPIVSSFEKYLLFYVYSSCFKQSITKMLWFKAFHLCSYSSASGVGRMVPLREPSRLRQTPTIEHWLTFSHTKISHCSTSIFSYRYTFQILSLFLL